MKLTEVDVDLPDLHPEGMDLTGPKEARLDRGSNLVLVVVAAMVAISLLATIAVLGFAWTGSDDLNQVNEGRLIDNDRAACRLQIDQALVTDRRNERELALTMADAFSAYAVTNDQDSLDAFVDEVERLVAANRESLDAYDHAVASYLDAVTSTDRSVLGKCARDRN